MKLSNLLSIPTQWLSKTPERALDQAYKAALKIKEIEDKHFQGQKISSDTSKYGESVSSYFQTEVNGYLQVIKVRLAIFKTSQLFINLSDLSQTPTDTKGEVNGIESESRSYLLLQKLKFIDEVTARYQLQKYRDSISSRNTLSLSTNGSQIDPSQAIIEVNSKKVKKTKTQPAKTLFDLEIEDENRKLDSVTDKTGLIPRSFMNTLNRIRQEIDPKSEETEEAVIKKFRTSRYKTAISIKFILLLIIVPLLTHQLTKTVFLNRAVENYFSQHEQIVFINKNLEEEAFMELKEFEESLHFKSLIGLIPKLSQEEIESQVKEKAQEISEDYRHHGIDAIANIFADICSFVAFAIVLIINRKDIEILKSFFDNILYGLSDSAKAFLIILFTDMFVGFHSPHGWEVILESVARHFGLPENRDFNFLFIATFPVILDTILKYWIFRYLNRISPSAVATYRNMNE